MKPIELNTTKSWKAIIALGKGLFQGIGVYESRLAARESAEAYLIDKGGKGYWLARVD